MSNQSPTGKQCQNPESRRTMTSSLFRAPPDLIILDDDGDNDVYIYAPTSPIETRYFFPCPSFPDPPIREEDLDLRLGVNASDGSSEEIDRRDCTLKKKNSEEITKVKLKCAICMDTMKDETSTLCGHLFCKQCITSAIIAQKRCPACRTELSISSIHRIFLPGAIP